MLLPEAQASQARNGPRARADAPADQRLDTPERIAPQPFVVGARDARHGGLNARGTGGSRASARGASLSVFGCPAVI